MLSPLPRHSDGRCCLAQSIPSYQPSLKGSSGRPVHLPFRGLLSVHSRYGLHTRAATIFCGTLHRRLQPLRYLHDCSGCFRREHFAGRGLHPLEHHHLFTAHTHCRNSLDLDGRPLCKNASRLARTRGIEISQSSRNKGDYRYLHLLKQCHSSFQLPCCGEAYHAHEIRSNSSVACSVGMRVDGPFRRRSATGNVGLSGRLQQT